MSDADFEEDKIMVDVDSFTISIFSEAGKMALRDRVDTRTFSTALLRVGVVQAKNLASQSEKMKQNIIALLKCTIAEIEKQGIEGLEQ